VYFEVVLGSKEFKFVVSEVTLTVVTRHSTSGGHGVSVLVSVTGSGSDSKLKIKMSQCCIILNNIFKTLPVMMEASTGNLWSLLHKIGKIVVKAVPNPVKQMSKAILRHTLIKKYFGHFC
jgi:hypothetical protein